MVFTASPGVDPDQQPLGPSAAGNVATVVKAYYLALPAPEKVSAELAEGLSLAGGVGALRRSRGRVAANPLAPRKSARRPRFLPDEAVEALFQPGVLTSARDIMVVTWLHDGGIRVGGLCGLRFSDLHLVKHHPCGQRAEPHVHIVGRDDNPNGARAKAYTPARTSSDGYVLDGVIRAVSADMISTFYAYLLDEYHQVQHLVGSRADSRSRPRPHTGGSPDYRWCSQDAAQGVSACGAAGAHHTARDRPAPA